MHETQVYHLTIRHKIMKILVVFVELRKLFPEYYETENPNSILKKRFISVLKFIAWAKHDHQRQGSNFL
jgi:hypothetical protein